MIINRLHGTVADRPINAQVVQRQAETPQEVADTMSGSPVDKINAIMSSLGNGNNLWLKGLPSYEKG